MSLKGKIERRGFTPAPASRPRTHPLFHSRNHTPHSFRRTAADCARPGQKERTARPPLTRDHPVHYWSWSRSHQESIRPESQTIRARRASSNPAASSGTSFHTVLTSTCGTSESSWVSQARAVAATHGCASGVRRQHRLPGQRLFSFAAGTMNRRSGTARSAADTSRELLTGLLGCTAHAWTSGSRGSGGRDYACLAGTVVRTPFPRRTPFLPGSRMSRSTVQDASAVHF